MFWALVSRAAKCSSLVYQDFKGDKLRRKAAGRGVHVHHKWDGKHSAEAMMSIRADQHPVESITKVMRGCDNLPTAEIPACQKKKSKCTQTRVDRLPLQNRVQDVHT